MNKLGQSVASESGFEYGSAKFESKILGQIKVEIKAQIGRRLFGNGRVVTNDALHIGCAEHSLAGFDNYDLWDMRLRFWQKRRQHLGADFRYKLSFPDRVYSYAYSEHTVEHLKPSDAHSLFREVSRVLRPNGVFRVVVPDLKKYVDFYEKKSFFPEFNDRFKTGCEAILALTQKFDHQSVWDWEQLSKSLQANGFRTTKRSSFMKSEFQKLNVDQEWHRWESLYVEAYV